MSNLVPDKRKSTNASGINLAGIHGDAGNFHFDTKPIFEKWLKLVGRETADPRSECEVTFEGVLLVDGACHNNIRSAYGTLVMTEQGHIEADIDVRIALIDGHFDGTLRASEHVVLEQNARVFGSIHTPSLTIRDGAVFDGNSVVLTRSAGKSWSEISEFYSNSDLSKATTTGA